MINRAEFMSCEDIVEKVFQGAKALRTIRDLHTKLVGFPAPAPKTKPRLYPADKVLAFYRSENIK